VRRCDPLSGGVELDEIPGPHVDRADVQARAAGIDAIKVNQALERGLQRRDIIEADRVGTLDVPRHRRRKPWREEIWGAEQQDAERTGLIEQRMGCIVRNGQRRKIRKAQRRRADGFPELPQPLDTFFRRIAGDQGRVDGADRDAGDPVRMQVRLGQGLVDAGLIRAERTAALQQQHGLFEPRIIAMKMPRHRRRWCVHVLTVSPLDDDGRLQRSRLEAWIDLRRFVRSCAPPTKANEWMSRSGLLPEECKAVRTGERASAIESDCHAGLEPGRVALRIKPQAQRAAVVIAPSPLSP
jgi:hypothetical protein